MNPGDQIAGYRIESVLGSGGMGTVYEATQLSLNRTVALKLLSPQLGADVLFRERFRREGHIQAAIDHPHIVTVYEAGEAPEGLFLAMRLVRGSTLKDMILGRDLEGARTLRLLKPIADALDTAHEAGLTHRDIKPQNILVGVRDHAFLADFGLTKSSSETGLTKTGQFVGTIDYIAPEQIRGEQAGAASDVYALTAVLYECLCGVVPYPKPSDAAVLYAHISDPPPRVTDERPELPPALDEVIARGMAKEPGDRQATASEMIIEAERAFGRRVRAVITPPGPVERPEDIGLREQESRVSTRQTRVRSLPPELRTAARSVPEPAPDPSPPVTRATPDVSVPDAAVSRPMPDGEPTADKPIPPRPGRVTRPVPVPGDDAAPSAIGASTRPAAADTVSPPRRHGTTTADQETPDEDAAQPSRSDRRDVVATRGDVVARRRRVVAALLALALLAVAGFVAGHSGGGTPATAPRSVSSVDVAVDLPPGWLAAPRPPAIAGLELDAAITVVHGTSGLVTGRVRQPAAGLLPAALARAATPTPTLERPTRTARLEGYRNTGLRVRGYPGTLSALTVPTNRGTLAFVCYGPASAVASRAACERMIGSARLLGGRAAEAGASAAYARRLDAALDRLNGEIRRGRRELARAPGPVGQSRAAATLGHAYSRTAAVVRRADAGPLAAGVNRSIARALASTGAAYGRLATAARSQAPRAYLSARRAVASGEHASRDALTALERLGYGRTTQ